MTNIPNRSLNGITDSEHCWTTELTKLNCTKICSVGGISKLPKCETLEEGYCIYEGAGKKKLFTKCNQRKYGLTFNGNLEQFDENKEHKKATVLFAIYAKNKEIREEVYVITTAALIGSVGGSLGMFFGFSIAVYVLYTLEKCITKTFSASNY